MDTQGRSLVDKCVSPMTRTMLLHHNDRILSGRCTKDELAQKVAQTEDKWKSFSITYKSIWGILCTLMRARARTASAPSLSSIVGPHAAHSFLQQRERLVTTRKFTSIQDILAIDAVHESVIATARVLAERKVRDDELIRRGGYFAEHAILPRSSIQILRHQLIYRRLHHYPTAHSRM